jgi:hypothetical protein
MYKIVTKVEKNAQKFQHMYITVCVFFFFGGELWQPGNKKKRRIQQRDFWDLKKSRHILTKKA